ncbi:unnamed protein product [Moneuplotes crassus]|uniref:Formyl transferase N-terminal domain-containing protein n=1 Tax=Euplotes crassus TaxID=5936 RepID=A0AAD2CYH4_EUPCR|nr:unnamed protein product [Moneuplotes crassus]
MATSPNNKRLLFVGSDTFSRLTLGAMLNRNVQNKYKIDVLSPPKGRRGTPIYKFHQFCEENELEINIFQGRDKRTEWRQFTKSMPFYNLGIVSSFRHMVPGYVINKFIRPTNEDFPNNFFYCVHPSLLPKYRGALPIQYTLLNGDDKAGVSLIHLSKRTFDAGNIVLQKSIDIDSTHTYRDLRNSLGTLGGELAADIALGDPEDFNRKSIVQNKDDTSKAFFFKEDDFNQFNFKEKSAEENLRIFNAFTGSSTEPFTEIYVKKSDKKALFDDLTVVDISDPSEKRIIDYFESTDTTEGNYKFHRKMNKTEIYIKCFDQTYLKFSSVRISGLGKMPASKLMMYQIGE